MGADVLVTPGTGEQLLAELGEHSSAADPITDLNVFSHGWSRGVLRKWDEGFYRRKSFAQVVSLRRLNGATIRDLKHMIRSGEVAFAPASTITLTGCNLGGRFAQRLANVTGATVVASVGKSGPQVVGGKETGRWVSTGSYYKYTPHAEPERIGSTIKVY